MAYLKFSQFAENAAPGGATTFLVGYDSLLADNTRISFSDLATAFSGVDFAGGFTSDTAVATNYGISFIQQYYQRIKYRDYTSPVCYVYGTVSNLDYFNSAAGVTRSLNLGNIDGLAAAIAFPASTTSISAPSLKYHTGIFTIPTGSLSVFNFPELECITATFNANGSSFSLNNTFPALVYIGGLAISSAADGGIQVNFPELKYCLGLLNISVGATCPAILLPKLTDCGAITITSSPANSVITSLSFPLLEHIYTASFSASNLPSLTSVSIPSIISIKDQLGTSIIFTTNTPNLNVFTLPSSLLYVSGHVNMTSCALNQASVDNILVRLAALDGTGGTIAYSTKNVTITGTSATPSATGLAAKAVLVARGCTVTTN